jgi:hypothetical protein
MKYAKYDPKVPQPAPVIGWIDPDIIVVSAMPSMDQLVTLTEEQWTATRANLDGWAVSGDTIVPYTGPPQVLPHTAATAGRLLQSTLLAKEGMGVQFKPSSTSTAYLFPTNTDAIARYTAAWSALNAVPPLAADGDIYIAADGRPVELTVDDAKALITKALGYFRDCSKNYAKLFAVVTDDPTTDLTVGWPSNE